MKGSSVTKQSNMEAASMESSNSDVDPFAGPLEPEVEAAYNGRWTAEGVHSGVRHL